MTTSGKISKNNQFQSTHAGFTIFSVHSRHLKSSSSAFRPALSNLWLLLVLVYTTHSVISTTLFVASFVFSGTASSWISTVHFVSFGSRMYICKLLGFVTFYNKVVNWRPCNVLFWVGRYNKTLNDWPLGKQWVLFPIDPQNSLFPLGPSHLVRKDSEPIRLLETPRSLN